MYNALLAHPGCQLHSYYEEPQIAQKQKLHESELKRLHDIYQSYAVLAVPRPLTFQEQVTRSFHLSR